MAVAALAVDLGNWYLQISKIQRAADAAALAGSVYLPDDLGAATTAADQELTRNNFTGTVLKRERANDDNPELMRVQLQNTTKTYFISQLGIKSFTFKRTAIAGQRPPIRMGSPNNVMGRQPTLYANDNWSSASVTRYQGQPVTNDFYLSQGSQSQTKQDGDRWANASCATPADLCNGTNQEYDPVRSYGIKIPKNVGGKIAVEVFDGTYAFMGLRCSPNPGDGDPYQQEAGKHLAKLYTDSGKQEAYHLTPFGNLCTGDDTAKDLVNLPEPQTTFSFKAPTGVTLNSSCAPVTFKPLDGNADTWWAQIQASSPNVPGSPANGFLKWSRVCTVDVTAAPYDRELKMNSQDQAGASGSNRYSLRAAFLNGAGSVDVAKTAQLSMYGRGRLGLRTSDTNAVVTFTVGRVPAYKAGEKLHMEFFDLGDGSNGPVKDIKVVPGDDWQANGSAVGSFSCTSGDPITKAKTYRSSCVIPNVWGNTYNGHIVPVDVNIPAGFTCNRASPGGCWVILQMTYGGQIKPADTTTWSVEDLGTPLRLYNEDRF